MANHPECFHLTEDVRDWKVIVKLKAIVDELRENEPDCIINIWASLECTHFSKAKGGLSRDADSRTLASHLFTYEENLKPNGIYIENVEEFLTWGPLDDKGKPIKELKGVDYNEWRDGFISKGFDYDYKLLNSADYGAYTSRKRYFGVFVKQGFPIVFPEPSHSKGGVNGLKPWKPVKDVLQLEEEGVSVFGNNAKGKPFAENTLKRVYYGLKKFHHEGVFVKRYNGGKVNPQEKSKSANRPLGTILSNNTHAVVKPKFLTSYYGNGTSHSVEDPCNTLTTKERYALHSVEKKKWLVDTQFDNKGRSINEPCQTLIARMDKKPVYMVSANPEEQIDNSIEKQGVRPIERLMRYYMRKNGIADVKLRMLFLDELKKIQGFPDDYVLTGTKKDKLKFIGNSVVPLMAQRIVEENYLSHKKSLRN